VRRVVSAALIFSAALSVSAALLLPLAATAAEDQACDISKSSAGVFDHVPESGPRLTSRLFAIPKDRPTAADVRTHLVNEIILAHFGAAKLVSVEKTCRFDPIVDSNFLIYFDVDDLDRGNVNECSLSRCARSLSSILKYELPDERAFRNAIDSSVAATEQVKIEQPGLLALGLRQAAIEVFRQLYADGTPEKIAVTLDASDFAAIRYEDFLTWYRGFSDRLAGTTSPLNSVAGANAVASQNICKVRPGPMVRQLDIDRRGGGHKAILVIDQGYSGSGAGGIANAALRELCPPYAADKKAPSFLPDRLAGRMSCVRDGLGDDRWLVVYSSKPPVATLSEMTALAESLAPALGGETCSDTRARIYVANFTRED
jgi:hypothetical protein